MTWAMPQAIERSVATPTIRARLPARNPMQISPSLPGGGPSQARSLANTADAVFRRCQSATTVAQRPRAAARTIEALEASCASAAPGGDADREVLALEDLGPRAH